MAATPVCGDQGVGYIALLQPVGAFAHDCPAGIVHIWNLVRHFIAMSLLLAPFDAAEVQTCGLGRVLVSHK